MILNELKIENFRSYKEAEIKFSPSQNYFFGRNWQGKSSIMDAIGFALFGRNIFPTRIAGAPVRVDHLVREGADEGFVEVVFEHNGRTYVLRRECPGNSVEFSCEGKTLGESTTTVKDAVYEKFGLDSKLFANVFYAEQDELRKILESNPEDRKVFVEMLLGFDYLKDVKMSAKHASEELSNFADEITGGDIKTVLEMIDDLRKQVEEKAQYVTKLEESIENEKKHKSKVADSSKVMSASQDKVEKLQDKMSKLENEIDANKELSSSIKTGKCPTCKQTIPKDLRLRLIHDLKEKISDLQSRLEKIGSEHSNADSEWRRASSDYLKFERTDERLFGFESERNQNARELHDLKTSLLKYEKQYKAFVNKKRVLETIGNERDFLERFQSAIESFRNSLRRNVMPDLENGVNSFMSQFSDNDFDAKLRVNDEFGFEVLLHGTVSPIFNLSGAAKDILALAVRHGLYRIAARNVDFILFDEPTRHMDSTNTLKLKQTFNEMRNQQTIVITVHDELFDAEGKKFMIEKDDSLMSTVRELNPLSLDLGA